MQRSGCVITTWGAAMVVRNMGRWLTSSLSTVEVEADGCGGGGGQRLGYVVFAIWAGG